MKRIEYYLAKGIPNAEELQECLNIYNEQNVVVCLKWYVRYNGWHELWFDGKLKTVSDCLDVMPKMYGL